MHSSRGPSQGNPLGEENPGLLLFLYCLNRPHGGTWQLEASPLYIDLTWFPHAI